MSFELGSSYSKMQIMVFLKVDPYLVELFRKATSSICRVQHQTAVKQKRPFEWQLTFVCFKYAGVGQFIEGMANG